MDLNSSKSQASLKSIWKQRHDQGRGTVVKEGYLGDGSVDPSHGELASLRLVSIR